MVRYTDVPSPEVKTPDRVRTKWTVLVVSVTFILVVAVWTLLAPEQSATVLGEIVG